MGRQGKSKRNKNAKKTKSARSSSSRSSSSKTNSNPSWVDSIQFVSLEQHAIVGVVEEEKDEEGVVDIIATSNRSDQNDEVNAVTVVPPSTVPVAMTTPAITLSILSWNVLAEAYCSRYSQVNLPVQYQKVVFNKTKRKELILRVLQQMLCEDENENANNSTGNTIDVVCLQEVDLPEIGDLFLQKPQQQQQTQPQSSSSSMPTYCAGVETPRVVGGGAGGRTDSCAVYVRTQCHWELVDHELVRLDDLATLSSSSSSLPLLPSCVAAATAAASATVEPDTGESNNDAPASLNGGGGGGSNTNNGQGSSSSSTAGNNINSNVQGMQMSLLRRNMAVLVRLRHRLTNQTVVVANAHLYWNPGFEYVKLCQAHYILKRAKAFQRHPDEPFVLCGDLNSRPGGVTHTYLTHGHINAKRVAPWYALHSSSIDTNTEEEEEVILDPKETPYHDASGKDDSNGEVEVAESDLVKILNGLNVFDDEVQTDETPRMRYLLDASLNKLCRWLRILGQDVELETDEEEKLRTGKGEMVIFERCVKERRTLVTTSPRLMQRRDCPPSVYCIHPPFLSKLEVALVHLLITHGVVLEPSTFLTRCVVCNGNIVEEHDDDEKRRILTEYEAPPDLIDEGMAVYECDGCKQGYWWNDLPTSSASRVKTAATRLLELCIRGGVPIREGDDADGLFQLVNVQELQEQGWDNETLGSELLQQRLDVVDWLKQEHLECPFALESAYAHKIPGKGDEMVVVGEILPFTNVTHQFVDTLDYIFFDKQRVKVSERLYVPTSFRELGDGRTYIENAHLLPSDVWPSDHLAIGARLSFLPADTEPSAVLAIDDGTAPEMSAATVAKESSVDAPASVESDLPLQFCAPTFGALSFPPLPKGHGRRCACGCVPAIPSLFEMAELRKQAKLKASETNSG